MKLVWWLLPVLVCMVAGCASSRLGGRQAMLNDELAGFELALGTVSLGNGASSNLEATAKSVQIAVDSVLWNIENANSIGYRRVTLRWGSGKLQCVGRSVAQGNLSPTGESLHVAIVGPGFFEVELPDGTKGYTRDGAFRLNSEGNLTTATGYHLAGTKLLRCRTGRIAISQDGTIRQSTAEGEVTTKLRVVDFLNAAAVNVNEEGFYIANSESGLAEVIEVGGKHAGDVGVMQGYLELSNVSMVEEVVTLVRLQQYRRTLHRLVAAVDAP